MVGWRFEYWNQNSKRTPEHFDFTEEDKERRISMLKDKKAKHVLQPFDKDAGKPGEPQLHCDRKNGQFPTFKRRI